MKGWDPKPSDPLEGAAAGSRFRRLSRPRPFGFGPVSVLPKVVFRDPLPIFLTGKYDS